MKAMKKLFAFALAAIMVMAMGITVFATEGDTETEKEKATITVKGIDEEQEATVSIYPAVTYDKNNNTWVLASWAEDILKIEEDGNVSFQENAEGNPFVLTETEGISDGQTKTKAVGETSVVFDDKIVVGAYVVQIKQGEDYTYNLMLASTYNKDSADVTNPISATVYAKYQTGEIPLTKEGEEYVAVGETTEFKIETLFPAFYGKDGETFESGTFEIKDTYTGLKIQSDSLTVEMVTKTEPEEKVTLSKNSYTVDNNETDGTLTITINVTDNEYAGKTIRVTYSAEILANGYTNKAVATKNQRDYSKEDEQNGIASDLTITKTDEKDNEKLAGAQFVIYYIEGEGENGKVKYVEVEPVTDDGVIKYYQATGTSKETEEKSVPRVETLDDGTITVKGLDAEVEYYVKEVVAPEGYSLNNAEVQVKWNKDTDKTDNGINVQTGTATVNDTKLSALPSTGGIGTTIFTICGVCVMVGAASLFFVSRRRNAR